MGFIIYILANAIQFYLMLIMATIIISWLVFFNVVNMRNKWVYKLCMLLARVTEPVYKPIRRFIPPMAGMDFTPMIVIFGLMGLRAFLVGLL